MNLDLQFKIGLIIWIVFIGLYAYLEEKWGK